MVRDFRKIDLDTDTTATRLAVLEVALALVTGAAALRIAFRASDGPTAFLDFKAKPPERFNQRPRDALFHLVFVHAAIHAGSVAS